MAVTRTYAGSTTSTSNSTAYTFTDHAISTAAADRLVVVGVSTFVSGASTPSFGTLTIGGNNATTIVTAICTTAFAQSMSGMFFLLVPTGTTATIVVNLSGTGSNCAVSVWAVYGAKTTAFHSNGNTNEASGTSVSTTLNIPDQGVAMAASYLANNNVAHTATGLTEDADALIESSSRYHAMSSQSMSAETARTITSTGTAATFRALTAVSWEAATFAPPVYRRRTRFFQQSFYRPERKKLELPKPRSLILPNSYKRAA